MRFDFAYHRDSVVHDRPGATELSLSPDQLRTPTFFRGAVADPLRFREALGALHDVVVSDLRWRPKDRTDYRAWRARQDQADWQQIVADRQAVARRIGIVIDELNQLYDRRDQRWTHFYAARNRYFHHLMRRDFFLWLILDPVITVHPDEVSFECFSRDESSYGRLSARLDAFDDVRELACGTTNVDYSEALNHAFQKIRTYKQTTFEIDPTGFQVRTTDQPLHKEVKVDLPESWVRGFLQVSSAMGLPTVSLDLHPMDLHNICRILRRRREVQGPRSLRFQLEPERPPRITVDPWGLVLECPRAVYHGQQPRTIRVWGRRRISLLERLIPIADRVTVHLLGDGMPSFYLVWMGPFTFTLGLSGWTALDWSASGQFDLLAPRMEVDSETGRRVFEALKQTWSETPETLARRLDLEPRVIHGALTGYAQAGRALFDLNTGRYRARELTREPLDVDQLRFVGPTDRQARRMIDSHAITLRSVDALSDDGTRIKARAQNPSTHRGHDVTVVLDADERIIDADCTCGAFQRDRLRKGPCPHILATRMLTAEQMHPERVGFRLVSS